jgi:hypothetical protein
VDRTPVPESVTLFLPAPPPALTMSVAALEPVLVGLNLTLIVQLAPAATEVPQSFVCVNCKGLMPPKKIDVIGKGVMPVLCRMIGFALEARFSA